MSDHQVISACVDSYLATVLTVVLCGVGLAIAYAIYEICGGDR